MTLTNLRKYAFLCATLFLCGLLFVFLYNLRPLFDKVEKDYAERRAINLSPKSLRDSRLLSDILYNNGYVTNQKDADYIADTLVERVKRLTFSNLYDLQKRAYGKAPMMVADSAGVLVNKVSQSNEIIGLSDIALVDIKNLESVFDINGGDGEIKVIVKADGDSNVENVIVRIMAHYRQSDSVISEIIGFVKTDAKGQAIIKGLGKEKGYSVLPIRRGYEYGREKGVVCGHFDKEDYVFSFEQLEHRIQMIDNATLKQIKNDGAITVRTPSEYKSTVIRWFAFVLTGWWILCFVLVRRKKNFDPLLIAAAMLLTCFCVLIMFSIQNPLTETLRGVEMAKGVLMGLACVVALQYVDVVKLYRDKYIIHFDPLHSLLSLPDSSLWPLLPFKQKVSGLNQILLDKKKNVPLKTFSCLLIFICFILHAGIYVVRWLFLPFRRRVKWLAGVLKDDDAPFIWRSLALVAIVLCVPFLFVDVLYLIDKKAPKGIGWLLFAMLLTALLWTPIGQAIGGMKVNLKLGGLIFQPSEVAKYLILFFMAAFFTQKADIIINYSKPAERRMKDMLWGKVRTLAWVIGGLSMLMVMYAALGDMGPALVIGVTFVLLYSLVKSKVNLDNLNENDKWRRIFTCDFAMLIYGVLSFAAFIFIGGIIGDAPTGALLWFIAWIVFGYLRYKQFFETAFIMNLLVFVFVFGGQIMQEIPFLAGTDTAERFEQRTRMCVNTWGDLDIEYAGANAEAVSNTQVANGLWGLATGGMAGQGLGKSNPNLIPAFHTDMILSSIGEQTGWIGLLIVVLVLALLLRRMIVVGYRVGHPFAFYFCSGVAIVTGVQFFIIALGSSGMVPLTGITVPFLSYGRVSMILNLVAFGVVLSLSQNVEGSRKDGVEDEVRRRSVGNYNYPVSIVSWTFAILALFTLGVWQYYCFWNRGNTLVHPAFVYNNEGVPIIEYNPRIALLTKEMWAGNIYDRNRILLATSDKSRIDPGKYVQYGLEKADVERMVKRHNRRYYPFGEHLFFMLGDIDNGLYFSYNEDNPIGYMAEAQHLAYLRDYDNVMRDEGGNAVKIRLEGNKKSGCRFVDGVVRDTVALVVRDNSDLIKYLKEGIHGSALKRHNKKVHDGKFDLCLTLDAKLQTYMQNELTKYVASSKQKDNGLLRVSVVVLDAQDGDMLTSANYPLPDYVRLRSEDSAGVKNYSDNYKDEKWRAYTDRDLGLTYQTMPGSTAKVMSALAGLNKLGVDKVQRDAIFPVYRYEVIDINSKTLESKEPPMGFGTKAMVNMRDAIVLSSNCYFINLVNYFDCYDELEKIYASVGVSLNNVKTYTLDYKQSDTLKGIVSQTQMEALSSYGDYLQRRDSGEYKLNKDWKTLRRDPLWWAWGQGTMDASPLNMARVASAVINDGKMPITRYLMQTADKKKAKIKPEYIPITPKRNATELKSYMQAQAAKHGFDSSIGGKTGTPERIRKVGCKGKKVLPERVNDGWYVFFIETGNDKYPKLAVAIRMERIKGETSGAAMRLAKEVVLNSLHYCKYL